VFVSAFIREVDVPVGKAVHTKPENALTTRLRLVRHCGPFLAARRQTRMRHSTIERNSTLVSGARASMPRPRDKSWVDFLPGRTGIQNENVPAPGHHFVRPETSLMS
jgi:hypothetical protein